MADLGMQIAELDARVQIYEECQENNTPLMSVPGMEPVECRVKWSKQHIQALLEGLKLDIRLMQAKANAMRTIVSGDRADGQ